MSMRRSAMTMMLGAWMWLAFTATSFAQVSVSLPLEGYCRPGRYMPVEISVSRSDPKLVAELTLRGEGAITTIVETVKARPRIVLPWLILRTPLRSVRWSMPDGVEHSIDLAIRPLSDDERLVGYTTESAKIAAHLFPGKSIIPIRLEAADPLRGPALAWEMLDALVVDRATLDRLSARHRQTLLAGGTILAVESDRAPDDEWNWLKQGDYQVLQSDPTPPAIPAVDEAAYAPTYDWQPGASAALRRQIVLAGAVLSILVLGTVLLVRRFIAIVVLVLVICVMGIVWGWQATRSAVRQVDGAVALLGTRGLVEDHWSYQTSARQADVSMDFRPWMRPVFAASDADRANSMRLVCDSDGRPMTFRYILRPQARQAFVSREIFPARREIPSPVRANSPMRDLVRSRYLQAGDRILGQLPGDLGWGTILVGATPSSRPSAPAASRPTAPRR